MWNRTAVVALVVLAQAVAGCDSARSPTPIAPSEPQPAPPTAPATGLRTFVDPATGFSTSDLHDAHNQIVQFTAGYELIWTADGTRLPGFGVPAGAAAQSNVIAAERVCQCWLVIRFGTINGERRAYLTADYGHDNPGTVVDLELTGGVLVVGRSDLFPPGTYSQSGVVTEQTATGPVPIADAEVWRVNEEESGWRVGRTDVHGFYRIEGLYDGDRKVVVIKEGYSRVERTVRLDGDTRFDVQLARQ